MASKLLATFLACCAMGVNPLVAQDSAQASLLNHQNELLLAHLMLVDATLQAGVCARACGWGASPSAR
jgi:hypothetical protein